MKIYLAATGGAWTDKREAAIRDRGLRHRLVAYDRDDKRGFTAAARVHRNREPWFPPEKA
jgi:hypothetical protein